VLTEQKFTQPPPRYNEGSLVRELEKRGIGRPSTYAPIIKTLLDRQYALRENRSLRPTETGEVVSEFLETHFGNYISDDFTSQMENQLDHVALGELGYEKMLKDFYTPFKKSVAGKKDLPKITHLGPAPAGMLCPQCQAEMIAKLGKSGKFFSCIRWPECSGARTSEGEEMKGPEATGEPCPECGSPLVTRTGRYGQFIACSTYPKCKYVKNDEEQEKKNDTGVECPKCHKGTMREKRGRYGVFYGCSNYPECKNIIKTRPTGRLCPTCGALMMEGTKTIPERCSSKICPNHNPHKLEGAKKAK
jgi:DNA topoisomerase-1